MKTQINDNLYFFDGNLNEKKDLHKIKNIHYPIQFKFILPNLTKENLLALISYKAFNKKNMGGKLFYRSIARMEKAHKSCILHEKVVTIRDKDLFYSMVRQMNKSSLMNLIGCQIVNKRLGDFYYECINRLTERQRFLLLRYKAITYRSDKSLFLKLFIPLKENYKYELIFHGLFTREAGQIFENTVMNLSDTHKSNLLLYKRITERKHGHLFLNLIHQANHFEMNDKLRLLSNRIITKKYRKIFLKIINRLGRYEICVLIGFEAISRKNNKQLYLHLCEKYNLI